MMVNINSIAKMLDCSIKDLNEWFGCPGYESHVNERIEKGLITLINRAMEVEERRITKNK